MSAAQSAAVEARSLGHSLIIRGQFPIQQIQRLLHAILVQVGKIKNVLHFRVFFVRALSETVH